MYGIWQGSCNFNIKNPLYNFMSEYVVIEWGPKVKLAHVELTKADVICRDYAMAAVKLMSSLSLSEVNI